MDPHILELREWSRLAEELQQERVRLGNRLHHQLWRYYPQMLELTDDVTAGWLLELWDKAPIPEKAKYLRRSSIERLPKQHRIRRIDSETLLRILRQPAINVADGVAEAACAHIRSLIARLWPINDELRAAERKLDELCAALEGPAQNDLAILKSCPGSVGSTLPRRLPKLRDLSADAIIRRCGR